MDVGKLRILAFVYLILLFLMTVVPLGPLNATLNDNYTLHIRWDYLLHTFVYLPLPIMLGVAITKQQKGFWFRVLALALLMTISFELLQKLLPYRSFNINDMVANGVGAILGTILLVAFRRYLSERWFSA